MKTLILAGGFGTRLQEETVVIPKPMVEIGGRPILWHIMKIYATHGYKDFVIALGYKGDAIKQYFLNYHLLRSSVRVRLSDGHVDVYQGCCEDWSLDLLDTGLETQTGGRIKRVASWLDKEPFLLTYGDGVANVNIRELMEFHRQHGKLVTVTAVRPPARFGGLNLNSDLVTEFIEKPNIGDGWINGGFFVVEPGALKYIDGDMTSFEREPLERIASEGQLAAYRHEGFWQCMDTLRDVRLLNSLWDTGRAPWRTWEDV